VNPTSFNIKTVNTNKINIMSHYNPVVQTKVGFQDIPNEFFIKNLLFFLDVHTLPKFALLSKKSNECMKTHMILRVFFLNKEKQMIEKENEKVITEIEKKRREFFEEYEILPPSKESALEKIKALTYYDIVELKQCFRKYNKKYEEVISPLVILLGEKAISKLLNDGTRKLSYFEPAQKLLANTEIYRKICNFEFETITENKFKLIEKMLESESFKFSAIKKVSNRFHILLIWYTGVVEFHRAVRVYSLNNYDYDILTNEEQIFCSRMDYIYLFYFKLLRYTNSHCKSYEKNAQAILSTMMV